MKDELVIRLIQDVLEHSPCTKEGTVILRGMAPSKVLWCFAFFVNGKAYRHWGELRTVFNSVGLKVKSYKHKFFQIKKALGFKA